MGTPCAPRAGGRCVVGVVDVRASSRRRRPRSSAPSGASPSFNARWRSVWRSCEARCGRATSLRTSAPCEGAHLHEDVNRVFFVHPKPQLTPSEQSRDRESGRSWDGRTPESSTGFLPNHNPDPRRRSPRWSSFSPFGESRSLAPGTPVVRGCGFSVASSGRLSWGGHHLEHAPSVNGFFAAVAYSDFSFATIASAYWSFSPRS